MSKYIGKPKREVLVNLSECNRNYSIIQIMTELERQDQIHNKPMNKSYAFENK
jgi:hypothetical protein